MSLHVHLTTLGIIAAAAFSGCALPQLTHTPPGTSVEFALAKKPELVRLPAPPPEAVIAPTPGAPASAGHVHVPPVEPPMPERNETVEKVGDAYSRGIFCLRAERDAEAIAAFEEAVQLDATFTDAWENLALLYEKQGDPKKALEAFKKAKKLARQ